MESKVTTREAIISQFRDGQIIAIGGQTGRYMPERLIGCILDSGARHLTIYSIDTSDPGVGVGRLIDAGVVDRIITTHVGTNPVTNAQIQAGTLEAELSPMGNFIERIRCGGTGLGGVLTPTGIGTVVAEGKQVIQVDGRDYLLEKPLHAEVAVVKAWKADTSGNLVYRRAGRNFNPLMAMAADFVIAEVEELVEVGQLDPDEVMTPGVCVDLVVKL